MLLPIALKACASANAPVGEVLRQTFELTTIPPRSTLRVWFRALARLGQAQELQPLIDHPSSDVRIPVIHAFYQCGTRADVFILERLLADIDPEIRKQAREAIDRILAPDYVPLLEHEIGGPLTDTEHLAIRLMLGQGTDLADSAALAHLLSSESPAVRELARQALQPRNAALLTDALIASLRDALSSGDDLTDAILALQGSDDDRAVELLIHALARAPHTTRHAVATALASLGHRASAQLLDAFETNPVIRAHDGTLLAQTVGTAALNALLNAFSSPRRAVRRSAADGLLVLGASSVQPLLQILERSHGDAPVDVLQALGRLGSPDAFPAILKFAESADARLQTTAIRALARYDNVVAYGRVATALRSDKWEIREAAVEVIRHWDWRNHKAIALVSDAITDPHPRVRDAAAQSLQHLAPKALATVEQHLGSLLHLVAHGDAAARVRAAEEIRHLRGVLAFVFWTPMLFSPEGSQRWSLLRNSIETIADLTAYLPWRDSYRGARPVSKSRQPRSLVYLDFKTSDIPRPITDDVRFTVTCPLSVARQRPCVLDVWAHLADDYEHVLESMRRDPRTRMGISVRSKGPVPITRGTALVVKFTVPDLNWNDEDSLYWAGTIGNATFSFTVPEHASEGDHAGFVGVYAAGIQIARVSFLVAVGEGRGIVDDVTSQQRRISSAFASYATEDRSDVLARIQGMLSVVPDLDVFIDVMSLRAGQRWRERLEEEITKRDVLYLFWSTAASRSTWVEREWRTALRTKGLDGIDPVPLEPPDKAPPPQELAQLHFNEWTLQIRH